jgi:hypothetical protein
MAKEQTHMRDKCEEPIGTVDRRDSIESVTTAEATLVRGGVKPGPDGCIPDLNAKIPELPPVRQWFVPASWWEKKTFQR